MSATDIPARQRPAAVRPDSTETATPRPATSPVMALLMPEGLSLPAPRRLVVLVPDLDLEEAALARRVWNLAAASPLAVLYLGLAPSASEEPSVRRRLATLAALTRDDWVQVSTALALGTDWLAALRPALHSGDLIVCHSEQQVRGWSAARPLGNELCRELQKPVHLLSGFYSAKQSELPAHPLGRVAFWGGSLLILAAAFWVQVQISALPKNWAEDTLMVISVLAECGLIGLWSRAFS